MLRPKVEVGPKIKALFVLQKIGVALGNTMGNGSLSKKNAGEEISKG
jgi:hypothetical protein